MTRIHAAAWAGLAAAVCLIPLCPVRAAESLGQGDLSGHTCKDVMRLSGEDREIALALVHGYVLGRKGTTKYDVEVLAEITDRFIDYCLDNPKDNALAAFEKIAR